MLTKKEKQILDFIKEHVHEEGMPPTLREIMLHFRYRAIGTVQDHVASLERKGALTREKGKARGMKIPDLMEREDAFVSVPVLGQIAAGFPVLSEENILGRVPMLSEETKGKEIFGLRVSGDSMVEAGIHDGDTALIEKSETAQNGDIVAVFVDGETTLKEFRKEKEGRIFLIPQNRTMKPFEYDKTKLTEIKIIGKMIGLYRKYR